MATVEDVKSEQQTVLPLGRRVTKGNLRWYLVHCPEGREQDTCDRVRKIITSELLDDSFVPRVERVKKFHGEWQTVTRNLFDGYFVVVTKDAAALSRALDQLTFPAHMAGTVGRGYAPVDEDAQGFIESCMDGAHTIRSSEGEIVADQLHVLAGPLLGQEARVGRINRRKCLATVSLGGERDGFSLVMPLAIPVRR